MRGGVEPNISRSARLDANLPAAWGTQKLGALPPPSSRFSIGYFWVTSSLPRARPDAAAEQLPASSAAVGRQSPAGWASPDWASEADGGVHPLHRWISDSACGHNRLPPSRPRPDLVWFGVLLLPYCAAYHVSNYRCQLSSSAGKFRVVPPDRWPCRVRFRRRANVCGIPHSSTGAQVLKKLACGGSRGAIHALRSG
jgi:hypothetical protein